MKHSDKFRLDILVSLGTFMFSRDYLDKVQELLSTYAPKWSEDLHIWRYREGKTPVGISVPGALARAVRMRAAERGTLFSELERQHRTKGRPREFGSAELRGANDSLVLVVTLDEEAYLKIGDQWLWGNDISIQVCRAKVNGINATEWSRVVFEALCTTLSPMHARAGMIEEYESKNISHEGGVTKAVGVDISKHLPGLYWLNFLGKPYKDLIGRERLLTAPAYEVKEIDNGILIALGREPRRWNLPDYRDLEYQVLSHLGAEYFFDKQNPNRQTVAPVFHLFD